MTAPRMLDDSVLQIDPVLRLIASRCGACDQVDFPARRRCSRCRGEVARHLLPRRGTVWTWTTQSFAPVSPPYAVEGPHIPFVVSYVDLDGCCVETRLDMPEGRDPVIGEQVELVQLTLTVTDVGEVVSYAFRPAGGAR